ncbi:MAG: hypothetical protein MHM6MM_002459 [Cercozoa sp. M6MM]
MSLRSWKLRAQENFAKASITVDEEYDRLLGQIKDMLKLVKSLQKSIDKSLQHLGDVSTVSQETAAALSQFYTQHGSDFVRTVDAYRDSQHSLRRDILSPYVDTVRSNVLTPLATLRGVAERALEVAAEREKKRLEFDHYKRKIQQLQTGSIEAEHHMKLDRNQEKFRAAEEEFNRFTAQTKETLQQTWDDREQVLDHAVVCMVRLRTALSLKQHEHSLQMQPMLTRGVPIDEYMCNAADLSSVSSGDSAPPRNQSASRGNNDAADADFASAAVNFAVRNPGMAVKAARWAQENPDTARSAYNAGRRFQ